MVGVEVYHVAAMEPDLLGQEKGEVLPGQPQRHGKPQWSLTFEVRKSDDVACRGIDGRRAAMEPDL